VNTRNTAVQVAVCRGVPKTRTVPVPGVPVLETLRVYPHLCSTLLSEALGGLRISPKAIKPLDVDGHLSSNLVRTEKSRNLRPALSHKDFHKSPESTSMTPLHLQFASTHYEHYCTQQQLMDGSMVKMMSQEPSYIVILLR
jgi:hypothetical protein